MFVFPSLSARVWKLAKAKPGSENGTTFGAILGHFVAILGHLTVESSWAYSGPPGKQELFRTLRPDLPVP